MSINNTITPPVIPDPLGGTASGGDAVRSEKRKNEETARLIMQKDKESAAGLIALLSLLLNLDKKSENPENSDTSDNAQEQGLSNTNLASSVAAALGLSARQISDAVADVRAGKPAVDAASALYHATDKTKSPELYANVNAVVKKHYGLDNLPPATNANFLSAVKVVLKLEGGLNLKEPDGAIANYGINSKANPDIDVRKLSENAAVQLYKTRYWDKINGIDKMDQRMALAAMDLAVNAGVGAANKMVKESDGDLNKLMELRGKHYAKLISNNPQKYAQYQKSWDNRMALLSEEIKNIPPADQFNGGGVAQKPSKPNLTTTHAATIAKGGIDQVAKAQVQASLVIAKAGASSAREANKTPTTKV